MWIHVGFPVVQSLFWQTSKCMSYYCCDRELETLAAQPLRKATLTLIPTINQVNDLCSRIWTRDGVALVSWLGFAWKFLSQPRVQPSFPAHLCRSQLQRVVFKKCSEVWQCHVATRRWRQWKFQRVKGLRWLCSLRDLTVDPSRKKCDGSTRFLWIIHIVLWWWEWVLEKASACWPRGT